MPSKKVDKEAEEKKQSEALHKICCIKNTPGPKYKLKPLVGFDEHCQSKNRYPAYSIGLVQRKRDICRSPGPKYYWDLPRGPAFAFPKDVLKCIDEGVPGPKYTLPGFWSPAYSITLKHKDGCTRPTPAQYDASKLSRGPAYSFGLKATQPRCEYDAAIRDVGPTSIVKARGATFRIGELQPLRESCRSPGPKYYPPIFKMKRAPTYKFGIYHSACKNIPRTDCDERC